MPDTSQMTNTLNRIKSVLTCALESRNFKGVVDNLKFKLTTYKSGFRDTARLKVGSIVFILADDLYLVKENIAYAK